MTLFEGSAPALVAPMNEDFSINYDQFRVLVQRCIDGGVPAIVVNGTTGEASTLTIEEEHNLIKVAKEVANGKCKVIAGTGSNNTMYALEQGKAVEEIGVDGLLVVTPYYNKTSQQGLLKHFQMIADNVNTPIILYDVPSRTGMKMSVDIIVELAKHKNIVGLKDATADLSYTMEVITKTKDIEDFCVYSGNDDIIVPMMAAGAKGVISVLSNAYPKETEQLCRDMLQGDLKQAQELAYALDDINDQLFTDVSPINIKATLMKQGICDETLRLPLIPTTEDKKTALYEAMKKLEKLEC
ncbi:MAG: 4-hydroxy-tetrahydrodipicolinate synthase [Coprobacillaceae bacterium]